MMLPSCAGGHHPRNHGGVVTTIRVKERCYCYWYVRKRLIIEMRIGDRFTEPREEETNADMQDGINAS